MRSVSGASVSHGRVESGVLRQGIARKASRARRESFKPRPSVDVPDIGIGIGFGGSRWGDIPGPVEEEDEGC